MRSDPPPPAMPDSPLSASFCYMFQRTGPGRPDRRRLEMALVNRGEAHVGPLVAVIPRGPGCGPRRVFAWAARVLKDPGLIGRHPRVLSAAEAARRGLVRPIPAFELDVNGPAGAARLRHLDGRELTPAEADVLAGR